MTRRDFLKGSGALVLMGLAPGIVKVWPASQPVYMTATELIRRNAQAEEFMRAMAKTFSDTMLYGTHWRFVEDDTLLGLSPLRLKDS